MHAKYLSGTFFFHRAFRSLLDNLCERRSLHEGLGFSQGLTNREAVDWSISLLAGLSGLSGVRRDRQNRLERPDRRTTSSKAARGQTSL